MNQFPRYTLTAFILAVSNVIFASGPFDFIKWEIIEHHIELGGGISNPYLYDETTSPLIHSGSGLQGNIEYFLKYEKFYGSAEFYGNFSQMGNSKETVEANPLIDILLDINLDGGYKFYEKDKISLYPGLKVDYMANQWIKNNYSNSAFQYVSALYTGLHLYAERPIYFKGDIRKVNGHNYSYPPNMKVSFSFSLPLLGMYVKPMYHGFADISDPKADVNSSDSTVHTATIFNGMLIMESKLNLDYILKNGNSFRLSYWWKYEEFLHENYNFQYAMQGISLA